MKLKFKSEVRIKFEVKSEVKIEVDISSWRKLKMKKCDIETDNIITGKKENSNSEKVCLDDLKVKSEENNNFSKKIWIQCKMPGIHI